MADFTQTFGEIVLPRLAAQCDHQGYLVAADIVTFEAACLLVIREARRLGAAHLAPAALLSLEDWVATQILHSVDKHTSAIEAYEQSVAHVHAECARLDRRFGAMVALEDGL